MTGRSGGLSPRQLEALRARARPDALRAGPWAQARTPGQTLDDGRQAQLFPASFTQTRMWLLEQWPETGTLHHAVHRWQLEGALDTVALQAALDALLARHEALRTGFAEHDGEPRQRLLSSAHCPIEFIPHEQLDAHALRPFDLAQPPLLRIALSIASAPERHTLQIVLHHIVSDGWSLSVLNRELAQLYADALHHRPSALPELPLQYPDFALWQRQALTGPAFDRLLDFWRRTLDELPTLALPTDHPRPARADHRGARLPITVDAALTRDLHALARQHGCTLYMVLLAAFQLLLARYCGQRDVVVGTPVAGRSHPSLDHLIGFFANTLVLRADVDPALSVPQLLERVRAASLAAFDHADMPFEKLVEALRPVRDPARNPLFQVMFALRNMPAGDLLLEGADARTLPLDSGLSQFDLTLELSERDGALDGVFEYASALFEPDTVERMAGHYVTLLRAFARHQDRAVGTLPLLTDAERALIVERWNDTAVPRNPADTLVSLFEQQVARSPDATALVHAGTTVGYDALNRSANRLAHRLRALGVRPGAVVGIQLDTSPDWAVALIGVMKAGATCLPMDVALPAARVRWMLDDAEAVLCIAQHADDHDLGRPLLRPGDAALAGEPESDPRPDIDGGSTACVLYTSGSTGEPKGVLLEHGALCNRMLWLGSAFGLGADDAMLTQASPGFDVSVGQLFAPLLHGGRCVLVDAARRADSSALLTLTRAHGVTLWDVTPAMLHLLVDETDFPLCGTLRHVFCGGEAMDAELGRRFAARSRARLHNLYGPTEAAIDTTWWSWPVGGENALPGVLPEAPPDVPPEAPPIGRPIANAVVRVLDADNQPVPVGVEGELFIGGAGLARGYLKRPDLTAGRFVPDPFSRVPGARLYRTGDRVRWRADGSLSFAGRQDRQIKLRGFRIEPGEIEAALDALPGVRQAAVMPDGSGRLIAWTAGDGLDAAALRSALARTLPEYMLPSCIVLLPQLPLTLNGKIDRDALPRPAPDVAGDGRSAARSPRQQALAELWADVLERPAVGADDSFFELGGHSLLAARLASRIRQLFGIDLPLRAVFDAPTVSAMDALLQSLRSDGRPQPAAPQRMAHGDELPCAFAQSRLWFVEQWGASAGLYHVVSRWQLEGALDTVALQAALDALLARHEALRTGFAEHDGEPRQRLLSSAHCPIEFIPHEQLDAHALRPFDLAQPPLLRVALSTSAASAPERHTLQIVIHHIVSDGWSLSVLNRELAQLYADALHHRPSALPELPLQYPDFALWQRQALTGPAFDRLLDFWRRTLDELPTLALPTDHPRPARADHRGARLPVAVDAALTRDLHALARQHGCTLYMVLLAAFQLLLARYCGQRDVVVGTPVAGRSHPSLDPLIGFFANTLVLRADVDPALSVPQLLERVRAASLAAFDHADMPFEKLVEALRPVRDPARNPLFQVMFALQNAPADTLALSGLAVSAEDRPHVHAKFDLMLDLSERDGALDGVFEYASALFEPATVERMAGHYATLLRAFARHQDRAIGTLPLLTDAERALIVERWNDTAVPRNPADTLVSLFEQQVARSPDATALVHAGTTVGYDALNRSANRLAHRLRALGVGPDVVVVVRMQRSVDLVVAILATLKAGGAWLPIDPDFPATRARFMRDDAAAPVLLTRRALVDGLDAGDATVLCLDDGSATGGDGTDHNPSPLAGPDHLAYVIYTSGSTGRPKGVMVSHAAICNHMHWMLSAFGFDAGDRILLKTGISADASVWELLAPLLCGGQLVLADEGIPRDPALLARQVVRDRITVMQTVPSLLRALVEEHGFTGAPSLRQMFCGGEALAPDLVRRFLAGSRARLHNLYGPTEAAIDATWWTCSRDDDEIPIGRPVANMRAHVLDGCMQPVPIGVAGELYLGGTGLARAYLGRPELTAERFVADPFSSGPGARLYRTGDRVRQRADGSLIFLQRTDHQIKLRGFRIEPGEIEAALTADPSVAEAVVVLREDSPGGARLIGYVRGTDGYPDTAALKRTLAQSLPAHMVPAALVALDRLPRTAHGKLDRDALPAPDFSVGHDTASAPRTPVEGMLCELWADVLGLPQATPHSHFFELGGHSLLAVRLISRISRMFGVELPLRTLFELPTPAELAPRLQAQRLTAPLDDGALSSPDDARAPCTPAQTALWFIERWTDHPGLYHIVERWRLPDSHDEGLLQAALNALLARHPALRTGFMDIDGTPVQQIAAHAHCPLERITEADAEAHAQRPFALDCPPLARAALWTQHDGQTVLQWVVHHMVSDGWSQGVLRRDLSALYDALLHDRPAALPPLPLTCADHAARLQARLAGPRGAHLLAYWSAALDQLPVLELPTDRPRPAQPDHRGASVACELDAALTAQLRALARRNGCTLYMVLLAAWALLLARWSRQDDIAIGTPVAGRDQSEFDGVAGLFVNSLVMRIAIAADQPLPELLADVRNRVLAAFDHADQPFEGLVRALQPARDRGRNPLFQTLFVLQPADGTRLALDGQPAEALPVDRPIAKFDLTLEVRDNGDTLQAAIEYASALFDPATMARMAGHLRTLLDGFVAADGTAVTALPLLTARERSMLDEWSHAGQHDLPTDATLAGLFEQTVRQHPAEVALIGDGVALTYSELNARANRIAHRLRALGAGPDRCVGLCMKRSLDQAIALLGIVKAGAAYVPVDPDYPAARIDYMLRDAGVTLVLATPDAPTLEGVQRLHLDDDGIRNAPADNPSPAGDTRSLAYVLYTSGSTGQPKGVMVEQRSVVRLVRDTAYAKLDADETFLLLAPPTFDAATFELWGALLNGARCVVYPDAVPTAAGLEAVIRRHGISTLWLTAALFNTLIDERPEALRGLRQLLTGGEALSVPHVRRAQAALPGVVLINGYGPTEGTTFTCCHTIPSPLPEECTAIPIGRPIAHTTAYVLDTAMQPVPVGVEGELYIGGAGVARGYLGRPDLSAERFLPDPWSADADARLYRSGDRVRWRADGTLDFIGRNDDQIKLRGFRIEPGEIEAALAALPGVQQAAVMLRATPAGERRLLAWAAGEGLDGGALRSRLAERLPDYMLPSAVIALDRFPLTANGKLDRTRLPDPVTAGGNAQGSRPRDAAERHLLAIWESLFGRDGLSVEDDFFAIGGHSLMAVRLADAIERSFGLRLPLDTFWFRARTVRAIAGLLRDASGHVRWPLRVPIRASGSRPPLFCVHTIGGNLFHYFELARALPEDQPVIGLNAVGVGGGVPARTSVEAIAADCIAAMREQQPHGPYRIAGFSSGGTVAFEMAQQLHAAGEQVAFLGLLDTWAPGVYRRPAGSGLIGRLRARLRPVLQRDRLTHALLHTLGLKPPGGFPDGASAHWWAHWSYRPRMYRGQVDLYIADVSRLEASDPLLGWSRRVGGNLTLHSVSGSHGLMMKPPHVDTLAALIRQRLEEDMAGDAHDV